MSHPVAGLRLASLRRTSRIAVRSLVMRSSVVRSARRIVRVIAPMSAVFLAGVTTAQAQAVPRQPPPPNSPAPASQPPAPGTNAPVTTGQPAPTGGARVNPVTDVTPIEAAPIITFGADGVSL